MFWSQRTVHARAALAVEEGAELEERGHDVLLREGGDTDGLRMLCGACASYLACLDLDLDACEWVAVGRMV